MNFWEQQATVWERVKPPLRPSLFEFGILAKWIQHQQAARDAAGNAPLRVLILGATPEYHSLPWPPNSQLLAVDLSAAMLALWPGDNANRLCADWLTLTPAIGRFDLVLGDGILCQLQWPAQQAQLLKVLHPLLQPDGLLLTRAFVRDAVHEDFATALAAVAAEPQPSVNVAKLRSWLALQPSASVGISPRAAWQTLLAAAPACGALADAIRATEATGTYPADDHRCFHFATEAELVQLFCQHGLFSLVERHQPAYELGRHCPTLVLRANTVAATD